MITDLTSFGKLEVSNKCHGVMVLFLVTDTEFAGTSACLDSQTQLLFLCCMSITLTERSLNTTFLL